MFGGHVVFLRYELQLVVDVCMHRLAFGFVIAFKFVVWYDTQIQIAIFISVLVGGRKVSLVVSVLVSSLQPVLSPLIVKRLGSSFPAVDAWCFAVVGPIQRFRACWLTCDVLAGIYCFVGAVTVCWKVTGLEISFLCIVLFLSVVMVCSVPDTAVWILFLILLSSDPFV